MEAIQDFEDILLLMETHKVKCLIIESLIRIKSRIDHPRHQEDVRVLREIKNRRAKSVKPEKP